MRFGSHISIRNGYYKAAANAKAIGAAAFQYFPKNPRSLQIKRYDRNDAAKCAAFCAENGIVSIAHAPYPTNVAVSDREMREAIICSIVNDLNIVEDCGSIGLVVHFGSHKGLDPIEGYKTMIDVVNEVLKDWSGDGLLLIENTAGKGTEMGTTFDELAKIRQLCDRPEKIGFCLDTCHLYASGYWTGENWEELVEKGTELGYFAALKAVHLNNSTYESGSRRDRHANIHSGKIPEEAMIRFMTSNPIKALPMILETPDSDAYTHQDEITYLKQQVHSF
ncbi:MAG TPA: deoxyribonuclease IV [Bacillales bacterium]|nr:deoxyribonuclease IV [Bacillales bacterium]